MRKTGAGWWSALREADCRRRDSASREDRARMSNGSWKRAAISSSSFAIFVRPSPRTTSPATPERSSPPREQLWNRNVQGCSQHFKRTQRDIPFAAFDRSNVGPVQATRIGKLLLGDIELCSMSANVAGKDPSELRSRFTHCKRHPRLLPGACELADDESTDYK